MRASWVSVCVAVGLAAGGGCSSEPSRPPVLSTLGDGGLAFDVPATSADAPAADVPAVDVPRPAPGSSRCTADTVPAASWSTTSTALSDDFIPLCSGAFLLGDKTGNQVVELDVYDLSREPRRRIALPAAPGAMALDDGNGLLYVALAGSSSLARIDLATDALTTVALAGAARDVAVGNGGRVFALLASTDSTTNPVAVIDGAAGTVERTIPLGNAAFGAGFLAFDRPGNQLIVGVEGLSPSSLHRYAFDASAVTLTLTQSRTNAGGNGQELVVSPDGTRVAFPCGGGNNSSGSGASYTVVDFDSRDLMNTRGEWNVGAYPRSAAFSPDGRRLLATNGGVMSLFNVETHARLPDPSGGGGCSDASVKRVRFSRGGRIGFAYSECRSPTARGQISAWLLPE